ncbi:MAG: tetratricopeptide repeat protein [Flavobacteriales bacterium]
MISTLKTYKKYVLSILLFGIIVYLRSLSNGYNLDDELVTINHPLTSVEAGVQWKTIFNSPYSIAKFGYTYGYRPIVHLSFAIEHAMLGESPATSHLINLLLYLFTGIFLFYFLLEWLGKEHVFLAGITSLLFMIHPLHVEVVASIKNRDELLAFLFALLAMISYVKLINNIRVKHILLLMCFALMALLSKKTAIPILLLIPLLDVFYFQRWKVSSLLLFIPVVIVSLWVGLDFEWNIFIMFSMYTITVLGLLFILFTFRSQILNWYKVNKWVSVSLHLLFIVFIIEVARRIDVYILLLLIAPFLWLVKHDKNRLSIAYLFAFIISSVLFKVPIFIHVSIMGLFYLNNLKMKTKNGALVLFSVLLVVFLSFEVFIGPSTLLIVRQCILLSIGILYIRNLFNWSFLLALLTLVITGFFFHTLPLLFLFLTLFIGAKLLPNYNWISKMKWFELKKRSFQFGFFVLIVLILFFQKVALPDVQKKTLTTPGNLIELSNHRMLNNGVKEGRDLEFVENPLIYPHYFQEELATGIQVIGKYIQLEALPFNLRYYYGYKTIGICNFQQWETYLWLGIILLTITMMIYFYNRDRLISVALLLFLVPLILASNLFTLVAGVMAERHAYVSTLGLSILVAILMIRLKISSWNSFKSFNWPSYLLLIIFVSFALQSFVRVGNWQSSISLMEHDKELCRNSAHANSLLATSYIKSATEDLSLTEVQKQQHIDQAIVHMSRAIDIFPYLFNYHFDLGRFYVLKGNYRLAYHAFKSAHDVVPGNPLAIDELVKCSFDLNRTTETIQYGEELMNITGPQEKIIELMAYQALTDQQFILAEKWASFGALKFPANSNFSRLNSDAQNHKVISKN